MPSGTKKTCGDCVKYLDPSKCPRAEYKDRESNLAACWPTDSICEKFEVKKRRKRKQDAEESQERRERYLPFTELSDGRLAEEAFDGTQVYFLVYDPETGNVEKLAEIELETLVLKPIDNDEVQTGTVLLPSEVEEYESEERLMGEIRDFLNRWHEPPDTLSRTLDTLYCFLSYIYDLIPQLPYRRYLAPWGKGKSAWLESLGWICYRGIILSGSDTDKSVVRKLNNW